MQKKLIKDSESGIEVNLFIQTDASLDDTQIVKTSSHSDTKSAKF